MATCPQEVVVTDNGNGSYTLANNNSVPMTVTVTTAPIPSWSPLTIAANSSETVSVTHPGGDDTFCWSLSADCNSTLSKSVQATAPLGPYAEGAVIPHTTTINNTSTESLSVTITSHGVEYGPINVNQGQTATQTVNYTVTAADANAGSVTCEFEFECVFASGTETENASVTSSTTISGFTNPVLQCPATVDSYIVTIPFTDSNPDPTRLYDIWVDGNDATPVAFSPPQTSGTVNIQPYVAGTVGTVTIKLYWWDGGDISTLDCIECVIDYDIDLATGSLSNLFSCDVARIDQACDYEDLYSQHFSSIRQNMLNAWDNSTSFGNVNCSEAYYWKPGIESTVRMFLLACHKGLPSANTYKNALMDDMKDLMPRWLDGVGVPNTGSGSKYTFNGGRPVPETRCPYLSISRAGSWAGYAIWAIRKSGKATASDEACFADWAPRVKEGIDWLQDQLSNQCNPNTPGGFAHMPSHLLAAMIMWQEIAGYNWQSDINSCMSQLIGEIQSDNGFPGSDNSHNHETISNLGMIRDVQLCGGSYTPFITSDLMEDMGNQQANSFVNNPNYCDGYTCAHLPQYIFGHGILVGCSNAMANLAPSPTLANYPLLTQSPGSNAVTVQGVTVGHTGYGYAAIKDGESCP